MQITIFSKQTVFGIGAAVVAIFLAVASPNARAGIFNLPSEPADWNGITVGFNAGIDISNIDISGYDSHVDLEEQFDRALVPPAPGTPTNSLTGLQPPSTILFSADGRSNTDTAPIGGADIGYYKQIGHFVFGGGFGFNGTKVNNQSDFSETQTNTGNFINENTGVVTGNGSEVTDFASMRRVEEVWSGYAGGQLGVAWGRFLFYATGGAAFAQIDVRQTDRATTTFFGPGVQSPANQLTLPRIDNRSSANNTAQAGWYAGGGVQLALNDAVSAGVEYRHTDYGDTEYDFPRGHAQPIAPGNTTVSVENNEVLFKVTIWLGHLGAKAPPAPVAPTGK